MLDTVPFDVVFYSLDWHPENHISFVENVGQRKLHSSSQVGLPFQYAFYVYNTVTDSTLRDS